MSLLTMWGRERRVWTWVDYGVEVGFLLSDLRSSVPSLNSTFPVRCRDAQRSPCGIREAKMTMC